MEVLSKLVVVSDSFTVNMYDNGFMVEVGGRDVVDEWVTCKIVIVDNKDLYNIIDQITQLPKDN
jgi:hypothetical protein